MIGRWKSLVIFPFFYTLVNMKQRILLTTSLLMTVGSLWAQQQEFVEIAKCLKLPAMQAVHVKNGKQMGYVFGRKHTDSAALISENTIFQAASLTKVITAYTFFKLYDKGLIALDKPLCAYFKYNRLNDDTLGKRITARMVLTHRSGLLNWEGPVGTHAWRNTPLHTQYSPGTRYSYSGEAFYYLQLAMEKVTGKPLKQLVKEEVFEPFGMTRSDMQWNDLTFKDFAYGHYKLDSARSLIKWDYTNGAYTMYTNAVDYTKFVQKALVKGQGLKSKTHQLMISKANEAQKEFNVKHDEDQYVPCALGLRQQINEKGTWLWHTGSNPGFRCFFIANPKTKESLVGFVNAETGMPAFNELMNLFLEKGQTFWAYQWRNGNL